MPYVGKEPVRGQNRELDDISGSFNGGNTAFTMQVGGSNTAAASANQVFISLGGVMQNPGTDFTVASSTLTFTTPPANGLDFWGLIQGDAVDIQEPADGSVTNAKVASGAAIALDKLASTPAVLTGSTNNTICTVTGANAIQGESGLTFDGSTLNFTAASGDARLSLFGTEGNDARITLCADEGDDHIDQWNLRAEAANHFAIDQFASGVFVERLTIGSDAANGDVTVKTGNLVIGTAGKGIDFSAQTTSSVSGVTPATSSGDETLDHCEKGTWTPDVKFSNNLSSNVAYTSRTGKYVRIGDMVTASGFVNLSNLNSDTGNARIYGLPFQPSQDAVGTIMGDGFTFTGASLFVSAWAAATYMDIGIQTGGTGSLGGWSHLTHAGFAQAGGGRYFSVIYRCT